MSDIAPIPDQPADRQATRRISVIGAGAFGTAVSAVLTRAGHHVGLYCRTAEQALAIRASGENARYFPGLRLPAGITATHDLGEALSADVIFLAFPARRMDDYIEHFTPVLLADAIVVNLVKGLHQTAFTFAEAFRQRLPDVTYVALKGPTFARPLLHADWSGLTIGTTSTMAREVIQGLFRGVAVNLDHCSSAEAVDAISAIKNAYAIVLGLAASLGLSENTNFLIISRVMKEIGFLMTRLGYGREVLTCHCGLADTLMTGLCDTSRNRTLGIMIGRGISVDASATGFLAEGVETAKILRMRAGDVDLPLLRTLDEILSGRASPVSILLTLSEAVGAPA